MNPDARFSIEAVKAAKGSVTKWKKIENGKGTDQNAANCPLCRMFLRGDCVGCPVAEYADATYCIGTPFKNWLDFHAKNSDISVTKEVLPHETERIRLARAEREFLERVYEYAKARIA